MKTVEVKISELEGAALDWAVGQAIGQPRTDWSTSWMLGGPLIDRFSVDVFARTPPRKAVCAVCPHITGKGITAYMEGETNLIAAMRAIVAAHAEGDSVEVPEELVEA